MKAPRISVLIATADRRQMVSDCLAAIGRTGFTDAEVLILDQSRSPVTPLPDPGFPSGLILRHIRCPRRGKSAALNIGVEEARGSVLAFTDDDCRVGADWLEVIDRGVRRSGGAEVLTGRVLAGQREGDAIVAPSLRDESEEYLFRTPGFRDVLFGNNMALPTELLRRAGPFDESLGPGAKFPAAEDNELGHRLLRSGVPIRYLPELVVVHRSWRREKEQVELFQGYGVGQGAFYGKHARQGDLLMWARLGRNLWDAGRDAGGAALLGRGYDVRASAAFARGLLNGFFRATLRGSGNGRSAGTVGER